MDTNPSPPPRKRPPKRLGTKGASLQEYSLLLVLLGATAASMVAGFGSSFAAIFSNANTRLNDAYVMAFQQVEGILRIDTGNPPQGQEGAAYLWEPSSLLVSQGFLNTPQAAVWQAATLPPGLLIDANTGAVSGTPTGAGTYPTVLTVVRGSVSTARTFNITITP